jgi:hypothetical protein
MKKDVGSISYRYECGDLNPDQYQNKMSWMPNTGKKQTVRFEDKFEEIVD